MKKKLVLLIVVLILSVLSLISCGGSKVDEAAFNEWINKDVGLYVAIFEDNKLAYFIPGIILKEVDSTKNEDFMQAGEATYNFKDGVFNITIKDEDSSENDEKTFKEFSLSFKDGKMEAIMGDNLTYPMEVAKFNYIEDGAFKTYQEEKFDIFGLQDTLIPMIIDEVNGIKKLDDENKSQRSAGFVETNNLIVSAPDGYSARNENIDNYIISKKSEDAGNTYTIIITETDLNNSTFKENFEFSKGENDEMEVEQILGLETKAYHSKDDSAVKIFVNYGEKKADDKELLEITIESSNEDFDEIAFFNAPETQDILKSIKFK